MATKGTKTQKEPSERQDSKSRNSFCDSCAFCGECRSLQHITFAASMSFPIPNFARGSTHHSVYWCSFVSIRGSSFPFMDIFFPFPTLSGSLWSLRQPLSGPSSSFGRVEDWRVDYRVRWRFRRFRFGPQSGSPITFPVPALRTGRAVFPHLGSPVGSCVSHTGPRSHSWTTPAGLAPLPYSIHLRSRVAARPVDALTTPSTSDDPFTFACDASGVSGPFVGVSGFRHSRDPSPFGHRSSPEAPSLRGRYPASPVLRASPPP